MNKEELTGIIAPCGLDCGKCLAFEEGDIRKNASELKKLLGKNFSGHDSRFAGMNPVFEGYAEFARLLEYLSSGTCGGCRKGAAFSVHAGSGIASGEMVSTTAVSGLNSPARSMGFPKG